MKLSKSVYAFLFILATSLSISPTLSENSNLFREYIGAELKHVKFSDVPINSQVEFHFILSFAIYYTTSSPNTPTDGRFNVFWDTNNLSPSQVLALKARHSNVKVALSLGGNSVDDGSEAYFQPISVKSWLSNAVPSLTSIIQMYHLDGIDIDYEHFNAGPEIFVECIGKLVSTLKRNGVISFASIAPYDDDDVQRHYLALWRSYGHVIDYVNFQFYAYDKRTSVSEFLGYFEKQSSNYHGGKVLVSLTTDGAGGLSPERGFFEACKRLKHQGKLHGIFVWCADDSKGLGFKHEKLSQNLLAL